jgi:hypothetical protein
LGVNVAVKPPLAFSVAALMVKGGAPLSTRKLTASPVVPVKPLPVIVTCVLDPAYTLLGVSVIDAPAACANMGAIA